MRQITETIKNGSCCYVRCHMSKRQQLHLRDKRGTRHRRLQPHHTEKKRMLRKFHATFTHPLQCDLQPHVAEHHKGTNHTSKQPQPQPPHNGAALDRRRQPLHTEKHNVARILPNTSPMQPFHCHLQPQKCIVMYDTYCYVCIVVMIHLNLFILLMHLLRQLQPPKCQNPTRQLLP